MLLPANDRLERLAGETDNAEIVKAGFRIFFLDGNQAKCDMLKDWVTTTTRTTDPDLIKLITGQ